MNRGTAKTTGVGSVGWALSGVGWLLSAFLFWSCSRRAPRTPGVVMRDVGRYTVLVQRRGDIGARTCHRATTAAAVAAANVMAPLERKEPVSADKWAALDQADRVMLSTCSGFRKPWTEP